MAPEPFTALGIDVGGSKIAAGIVRFPDGRVLLERSIPTHPARASQAVLEDIRRLAEALATEAQQASHIVSGVGIGVCELVGPHGEILSQNLLKWDQRQIENALITLGPVTIEADVRAAARAEALFGAGPPFQIFLYVTVGTGIACSLVLEGVPYLGARGAAGTMASSPTRCVCEKCGQMNSQTLEQVASGPALVKRLNELQTGTFRSSQEVFAAATEGNSLAGEVIRSAAEALGLTIGLMVNVLDPEAVIIGGGLGLCQGPFWSTLIEATRAHIWSDINRDLPILRAGTGTRAGMIGAAAAAWKASRSQAGTKTGR